MNKFKQFVTLLLVLAIVLASGLSASAQEIQYLPDVTK